MLTPTTAILNMTFVTLYNGIIYQPMPLDLVGMLRADAQDTHNLPNKSELIMAA